MLEGVKNPWDSDWYVARRLEELSRQWREQAALNSSDYAIASAISASKTFSDAASIIIGGLQRGADQQSRDEDKSRNTWHRSASA